MSKSKSKYGYAILKLWRLDTPITLGRTRVAAFLKASPQKYNWAPAALLEQYPLSEQKCVNRVKRKHHTVDNAEKDVSASAEDGGDAGRATDKAKVDGNPKWPKCENFLNST